MAEAAPPDSTLMSLSEDLLLGVLQHVHRYDKRALRCTCKALRHVVLQHAPRLTLDIHRLRSDRSFREVREVVRRERRIEVLTLYCNVEWMHAKAQRLVSELAAPPAVGEHPCAVCTLIVEGDGIGSCIRQVVNGDALINSCSSLVEAFPSITALELLGVYINANMLQALAKCTRLVKLSILDCSYDEQVALEPPQLPAIRDLHILSHAHLWLPPLAPHLTKLRCELDGLNPPAISALAQCTQLVEVYLPKVDQAALEALLGLPCLTKVALKQWDADAGGRHCSWSQLAFGGIMDARMADSLPRGIHTLAPSFLYLFTDNTPAASLAASQALARALPRACRHLRLDGALGADIFVDTSKSPINLVPACVEGTLQGLAPLHPLLHNLVVSLDTSPGLSEALVQSLSAASSHTVHLSVKCATVTAGAWAALPAALPGMCGCTFHVSTLSDNSIAALGALCRDPGVAGGRTALRSICVLVRSGSGEEASLAQLKAELEAEVAPVELCMRLWGCAPR